MGLGHELVEMRPALVLDRARLKEQVHQHGLAAADLTIDVKAVRRRGILVAEQPAEQALLAVRLVTVQALFEARIGLDKLGLRRVRLDGAGRDESLVLRAERR